MTARALCATLLLCAVQAAMAADHPADEDDGDEAPAPSAAAASQAAAPLPPELADFCFIGTIPSGAPYQVIRRVKVGKGSYGAIKDILPRLAQQAKRLGADAVIEYDGSQRFGFFPWRVVRPVVRGVAIKWTQPPTVSCAALGGATLQTIMSTNEAPSRTPQAASAPAS